MGLVIGGGILCVELLVAWKFVHKGGILCGVGRRGDRRDSVCVENGRLLHIGKQLCANTGSYLHIGTVFHVLCANKCVLLHTKGLLCAINRLILRIVL